VLGSIIAEKPMLICAVTEDLVKKGITAGDIVKHAAGHMGGSGGGKPTLAQAGGKDPALLKAALESVDVLLNEKL
jgi:alanyl-tRNA synthetase